MLGVCSCHHEERSDVVVSWERNGGVGFSETATRYESRGAALAPLVRSDSIASCSNSEKSGHSLH